MHMKVLVAHPISSIPLHPVGCQLRLLYLISEHLICILRLFETTRSQVIRDGCVESGWSGVRGP